MSLDFEAIKRIRMVEVVSGHYKIPLRFRGDYANAPCPLPTHKEGDKGKSFSICLAGNYWRCFSQSCNVAAGKKGGDCINFVALMEGVREKDAAAKLADWFDVGKEKPAPRMERPAQQKDYKESDISESGVKYMTAIELWYDKESVRRPAESDDDYRKRFLNALKAQMIQSFRAGKAAVKV